jgi:SAM-dependent methyltransferase
MNRYIHRFKQVGLTGFCLGCYEKTRNNLLYRVYRFNPWHTSATYHLRPYKKQVVEIANQLKPNTTVEIGCGLGDIISRIQSVKLIGIDQDEGVIKAARLLYKNQCEFKRGSFEQLYQLLDQSCDLLIMVNWLHNIPFSEITTHIARTQKTHRISYLLVDRILPNQPGYQYEHSISDWCTMGKIIQETVSIDSTRHFLLLQLNRKEYTE